MKTDPRSLRCQVLPILVAALLGQVAFAEETELSVPPGFRASPFAGDELAHNVYSLTHDSQGRAVVSGPGYIKLLEDTNADGRAESARTLLDRPASGAQGLCYVGNDLYYTGDGGLWWAVDADGDGAFDATPNRVLQLDDNEHGAHQIVHGPDGWLYLVCGNDAGVTAAHIRGPTSPIREPRSGVVLRFNRDASRVEIVAHGFRNPYDLAFDASGRLFTVDSDGERDRFLPWYEPTRVFDVALGWHHGWVSGGWTRSWSCPEAWFDSAPRVAELGRGSPVGLLVYRHRQFPEKYQGGLFSACWTLGRVYFIDPRESNGAEHATSEVFLSTRGESGLAPVDMSVGPEGDLWLAVGGRGTRGGVYRIAWEGATSSLPTRDRLDAVLDAPEPPSAWSRAKWEPIARELGDVELHRAACDVARPALQRVRAIEILTEHFGGLTTEGVEKLAVDRDAAVVARLSWSLGHRDPATRKVATLARLTSAESPSVRRAAWESLAIFPEIPVDLQPQPNWTGALLDRSRRVRQAMFAAATGPGRESFLGRKPDARPLSRMRALWFDVFRDSAPDDWESYSACVDVFDESLGIGPQLEELEAVRLLQIAAGDAWTGSDETEDATRDRVAGYSPAGPGVTFPPNFAEEFLGWFPRSGFPRSDPNLNRELARLAGNARLDHPELVRRMLNRIDKFSTPEDDVHYLSVLAELPTRWTDADTTAAAKALAGLHTKMLARRWQPSRNWPEYIARLGARLLRHEPQMSGALANCDAFSHPEQAQLALVVPQELRADVARRMLPALEAEDEPATAEMLEVLDALPPKTVKPVLRRQMDRFGLSLGLLKRLAVQPKSQDRERFREGIAAPDGDLVVVAARALHELPSDPFGGGEIGLAKTAIVMRALVRALQTQVDPRDKAATSQSREIREVLSNLLSKCTGNTEIADACVRAEYSPESCRKWIDWFSAISPESIDTPESLAASFLGKIDWTARSASIPWDEGAPSRGRDVFMRHTCIRCHEASGHLGPELRGAAARLGRAGLLTATVDPNREVAPTYRLEFYETTDGRLLHGRVVYESPEGTLLQTDADTIVRLLGEQVARHSSSPRSLMPEGLLDTVEDRSIADLMAYLETLTAEPTTSESK